VGREEQLVPEQQPAAPLRGADPRRVMTCALWLPG